MQEFNKKIQTLEFTRVQAVLLQVLITIVTVQL